MDFSPSPRTLEYLERLRAFMDELVFPAEAVYARQRREAGGGHVVPPVIEELKAEARRRGLWNLFLADPALGAGLSVLEYAPLAELSGHSPLGPEAINCSAPDTGNMELLAIAATPEQRDTWLRPLLAGEIRSGFAMTEPDVASSDATNIRCRIDLDGEDAVVTGRKWWTTGALDPRCRLLIVMGRTDPEAVPHEQQSMLLVPLDTPGVRVERSLPVFGYSDPQGHGEVVFEEARVPVANLLGERGRGFALAQARLGPGRIHHCMRALGMAERALALMVARAGSRRAFGGTLAEQGVVRHQIAEARVAIDQARLLVLHAAWSIDTSGARAARTEISAIKAVVPRVACAVVDRAIQLHGGAGVSDDTPLAAMYAGLRTLRIADGPDEVHLDAVARAELRASRRQAGPAPA
ncbi:MAG: acyl-CoA dehydrogenase [Candidatus Dormibacteria bacterium]